MSEDAPQFSPPEGEQPEQQTLNSEVQEPAEELGNAALTGETTPVPVAVGGENFIDEDTARARAYVEEELKDSASDQRKLANAVGGFRKEPGETDYEASNRFDDENASNPEFTSTLTTYATSPDTDTRERGAELLRTKAESNDKEANELGDWAEALHKHPVSEAFIESHPEVDFSPSALVRLERLMRRDERIANAWESYCQQLEDKGWLVGIRSPSDESLRVDDLIYKAAEAESSSEARNQAAESLQKKWDELSSDKDTTLGMIGSFQAELIRKTLVADYRNYANVTKALLEDVSSGRASGQSPKA